MVMFSIKLDLMKPESEAPMETILVAPLSTPKYFLPVDRF